MFNCIIVIVESDIFFKHEFCFDAFSTYATKLKTTIVQKIFIQALSI